VTSSLWIAPLVERTWVGAVADERRALEDWLDFQRATLQSKCTGLTADQLKEQAVPPSNLSLLGIVRHMTDVERWWFRMCVASEQLPFRYGTREDRDVAFDKVQDADAPADLEAYRQEIDLARAAAKGRPLEQTFELRGGRRSGELDLRWVYLHMIEEYARHNGHADLIRERIDGATGI
jgi:uncharacterized damage-inducible protein DinB